MIKVLLIRLGVATWWSIVLVLIVGTFAGYLGPHSRVLDLIGGNRLQVFGLSWILLIPAAVALIRRRGRSFCRIASLFLVLVCVVVNSIEVLPWYFGKRAKGSGSNAGPELKFIALNVLHQNPEFAAVRDFVRAENPDFAVFFESTGRWPRELRPLAESLKHHRSMPAFQFEVFSRHPILELQERRFGRHRGYLVLVLDVGGKRLTVCPSHAYPQFHYGNPGFQIRNDQLATGIGKEIAVLDNPKIIIGDLNVDIWSPLYRSMVEKSNLIDARRGFGVIPTHWAIGTLRHQHLLGRPIDLCLVSPDIEVVEMKAGPPVGSDHLPIVVRLRMP